MSHNILFSDEKKPETRISRPIFPSPRESIHRHVPPKEPPVHEVRVTSTADVIMKGVPNKPQSIPFLKTPENQDPVIKSMRKFRDERMEVTSSSSPLVAASSSSSSSSSSQPPPTHLTVETATSSSSFNNSAGNGSGMTGGSGSGSGMTGVSMTGSGSGIGMTGGGGSSSSVTGGSINVETLSLEVEARSGLNVEIRKPTNPINKPIDGAPTRRPKVPKVLAAIRFHLLYIIKMQYCHCLLSCYQLEHKCAISCLEVEILAFEYWAILISLLLVFSFKKSNIS